MVFAIAVLFTLHQVNQVVRNAQSRAWISGGLDLILPNFAGMAMPVAKEL
jgi:hypothetical protein